MIFYLISSSNKLNPGLGGHYFSLMNIAEAVSNKKEVAIINIGEREASVLKEWKGKLFFIKASFFEIRKAINVLNNLCKKYPPDIIHAFDKSSGYFARRASMSCKVPWILTKCGGPNPLHRKRFLSPSAYYPKAIVQTAFHKNDYDWFKSRLHKPSQLELILARVKVKFSHRNEFSELNYFYNNAEVKISRIARISLLHFSSILKSVKFTQKMCKTGINARLAIIGTVDSNKLYEKLKQAIGNETKIFTSERFTRKASDFLPLADVAIGTGRSFMEGCAAGCIMMTLVKDSIYPALVTADNIEYFEAQNFSNRTSPNEEVNPDRDIKEYIREITSNKDRISKEMLDIFKKRYDMANATDKYIKLYEEVASKKQWQKRFCFDLFFHCLWLMYTFGKNLGIRALSRTK